MSEDTFTTITTRVLSIKRAPDARGATHYTCRVQKNSNGLAQTLSQRKTDYKAV